MGLETENWHNEYLRVNTPDSPRPLATIDDLERVRASVVDGFFDQAHIVSRDFAESNFRTLGGASGGDIPGDLLLPTVHTGVRLSYYNDGWRLVVARSNIALSPRVRVATKYCMEVFEGSIVESNIESRVAREQDNLLSDDGEFNEEPDFSRLEYNRPITRPDCLRVERQLGKAIRRYLVLGKR